MSKQNSTMSGPIGPENQATTPGTTTNSGPVGPPNQKANSQPPAETDGETEKK